MEEARVRVQAKKLDLVIWSVSSADANSASSRPETAKCTAYYEGLKPDRNFNFLTLHTILQNRKAKRMRYPTEILKQPPTPLDPQQTKSSSTVLATHLGG